MIEVHGIDYFVRLTDSPLTSELDGEVAFGDCMVTIRASLKTKKQQQTFWHEVMHIVLEGEDQGGRDKKHEAFVTRMSNMLYGVLVDNHLLVEGWWEQIVDEVGGPSASGKVVR